MIFKCFNNNDGICMWSQNRGKACGCFCERYNKCFTCDVFATCERIKEDMPICDNLPSKLQPFIPIIEEDDDLLDTWEEDNREYLEKVVEDLRSGKITLTEHELIETDEE